MTQSEALHSFKPLLSELIISNKAKDFKSLNDLFNDIIKDWQLPTDRQIEVLIALQLVQQSIGDILLLNMKKSSELELSKALSTLNLQLIALHGLCYTYS